jgi:hypothetical protein
MRLVLAGAEMTKPGSRIPDTLRGYVLAFLDEDLESRQICIYGDPAGLRSLGEALVAIADLDQQTLPLRECPPDESFHRHFVTREGLPRLTIGRVDRRDTGEIKRYFADR